MSANDIPPIRNINYPVRGRKRASHARGPLASRWNGGRVIASNGYARVYVGYGHPMADKQGYCYEHRFVVSCRLGRALQRSEQVHHIDGDKLNNSPANLQLVSHKEHRVEHRLPTCRRQLPSEPNEQIVCACGCGGAFSKYDNKGRPRRWLPCHRPKDAPLRMLVVESLRSGASTAVEISRTHDLYVPYVHNALQRLEKSGLAQRTSRGVWRLMEAAT